MSFMFPLDKFKWNHCLPLTVFLFPYSFIQPLNITHVSAIDSCITVTRHVATHESVKRGYHTPSCDFVRFYFSIVCNWDHQLSTSIDLKYNIFAFIERGFKLLLMGKLQLYTADKGSLILLYKDHKRSLKITSTIACSSCLLWSSA